MMKTSSWKSPRKLLTMVLQMLMSALGQVHLAAVQVAALAKNATSFVLNYAIRDSSERMAFRSIICGWRGVPGKGAPQPANSGCDG